MLSNNRDISGDVISYWVCIQSSHWRSIHGFAEIYACISTVFITEKVEITKRPFTNILHALQTFIFGIAEQIYESRTKTILILRNKDTQHRNNKTDWRRKRRRIWPDTFRRREVFFVSSIAGAGCRWGSIDRGENHKSTEDNTGNNRGIDRQKQWIARRH